MGKAMKIVRSDTVGTIDMRLVCRPTNTAIGVDNWHIYAKGRTDGWPASVVRFLGTDPWEANTRYGDALAAAQSSFRTISV
jgi:hypothetical protein